MAVTADLFPHEDSSSESSSAEIYSPRSTDSSLDHVESVQDSTDETVEINLALSAEARVLLKRTSRSLAKRRKVSKSIVAPLYRQLKSLRSLVPYSSPAKESCVVVDALNHLKRLKQEIEALHDGLVTAHAFAQGPEYEATSEVSLCIVDQRLVVYICCPKRPGLVSELMAVLEESGLVFDDVKASCSTHLTLFASCSPEGVDAVEKEILRRRLLDLIKRGK